MNDRRDPSKELSTYEQMLRIQEHHLDEELIIQAETMWRICERVRVMDGRVLETADALKRAEGEAFSARKLDGGTDKESEQAARNDDGRKAAWQRWQLARSEQQAWQSMLEAWKAKGYAISKLCDLYAAQYFTKDSARSIGDRSQPRPIIERHDYTRDRSAEVIEAPRRARRAAVG